ncbi:hypothetical protein MERGE_001838 [Pneumocystis wakefieldiae]|uniref:C2H2-type domain-containing protein n=1 Tax=Pneumocystis wakefieldiae TaxID=38082 RepID=A0A899G7J5_9ASCO|nr:hypothetical protein MERGE_001838 [Pneumocystis wakefieldiae]
MFLNKDFNEDFKEDTETTKRGAKGENLERKKRQKKIYKCTFEGCNKAYSKPCRIEEHLRSHTGERPFVCNFKGCEKGFFRKSHLKAHIHSHVNEKPYLCKFKGCIARFNTNQHLKRHEEIHLRETPYKHHQLLIHIANTHTHKKPFLCEYDHCKKSFDTRSKLNSHISRIHLPIPSYFCGIEDCNQKEGFSKLSLLQKHLKNDHCIICKICNKKFSTNTQLKLHLQIHEKSLKERRLYHCTVNDCQKSFTRSFYLQKHIEIVHEQKKEFVCNIDNCNMKFGYKKLLIAHQLHVHSQSEENDIKKIRSKVVTKVGPVNLLTGFDYSGSGRDISCLVQGCKWQFLREYDLKRHIKSYHSDVVI